MNARYLASQFRPTTLAAMIADLLDMPVANAEIITALLEQLKATVGDEGAETFLVEVGITPGRGAKEYKVIAPQPQDFCDWIEWQRALVEWYTAREAWDAEVAQ